MSSPHNNSSNKRVLQKKKRIKENCGGILGGLFSQQKLRRHSSKISQALQEAEESESHHVEMSHSQHDDNSEAMQQATGIPVMPPPAINQASSSWSSNAPDVQYVNVGGTGGALQNNHAVPSPEYLNIVSSPISIE